MLYRDSAFLIEERSFSLHLLRYCFAVNGKNSQRQTSAKLSRWAKHGNPTFSPDQDLVCNQYSSAEALTPKGVTFWRWILGETINGRLGPGNGIFTLELHGNSILQEKEEGFFSPQACLEERRVRTQQEAGKRGLTYNQIHLALTSVRNEQPLLKPLWPLCSVRAAQETDFILPPLLWVLGNMTLPRVCGGLLARTLLPDKWKKCQ